MRKYILDDARSIFRAPYWVRQEIDRKITGIKSIFARSSCEHKSLWREYDNRFNERFLNQLDENSAEIEKKYGYPDGYIKNRRRANAQICDTNLQKPRRN